MRLEEMRLAVHPGVGLVARFERTVLLVLGDVSSPAAAGLVDACRNHESAAERLRAIGAGRKPSDPAFFALVEGEDEVLSFIAGVLKVSIDMEGSRMELALTDRAGWMEEKLRGRLRAVAVAERSVRAGSQPLSDLVEGVVSGGGVELIDRGSAAAAPKTAVRTPAAAGPEDTVRIPRQGASVPDPVPEPTPVAPAGIAPDFEGFDERATMAGLAARPAASEAVIVEGRECAGGHLNDPLAPACRVCGAPLQETVSQGPRPPLGRLVSKDGIAFIVDRDFMIGRRPETSPEVAAGVYAALEVPEGEAAVSRVHAEVRIAQWSVLLTDRNSANGTFIRPPDVGEWIRLEPGHTVQITPGSAIMVGNYEFSFEG